MVFFYADTQEVMHVVDTSTCFFEKIACFYKLYMVNYM